MRTRELRIDGKFRPVPDGPRLSRALGMGQAGMVTNPEPIFPPMPDLVVRVAQFSDRSAADRDRSFTRGPDPASRGEKRIDSDAQLDQPFDRQPRAYAEVAE